MYRPLSLAAAQIENLIKGVPGFVSYVLIQSSDGGCSVTVCYDKAGCDESTRLAGQFIRDNAGNLTTPAAMVSEGEVLVRM